jgi:hypothetical protein
MRVFCRKKRVNQMYLMAMLEMGIPKHKAEVALTETGNVGVEVATEWLFSAPESAQFEHYASDTGALQQQESQSSKLAAGPPARSCDTSASEHQQQHVAAVQWLWAAVLTDSFLSCASLATCRLTQQYQQCLQH